jgi:hypothetical protein
MDAERYRTVVRMSALYDLVVTVAFVTPWSFALLHGVVAGLDAAMGAPGEVPLPDALTVLLGNLLGSVVVVWSLARLHLGSVVLGRYDALARLLFAAWQINAMTAGLSMVILPLTAFEILFGILQAMPLRKETAGTVSSP